MRKYKIIYDREGCIGAAACAAVMPETWEIDADGKANLLGGTKNDETDKWELIFDEEILGDKFEEVFEKHRDAAESCPVQVIKIIDMETEEEIV